MKVIFTPPRTHPHVEFDVFVSDGLNIESDGGDGVDGLPELELVQDGGLAGGVQAQHQDPHLLVAKHFGHNLAHGEAAPLPPLQELLPRQGLP